MEKPKTLEQLRAEKERAETQLAQEQHKLERLENRKNIWNSVYKPQFRQKRKRSRSPAGLRRLGTATRISASLSRRLSAFFGSTHDQAPKAAKYAVLTPGHAGFPNRAKRSEGSDTTPVRNARVSACEPLCAGGVEVRVTDALDTLV